MQGCHTGQGTSQVSRTPYTGGHSSRVAASQGWVWRARPVMGCFDSTARDKPVPGANQEQTGQGHSTALKRSIL